MSLCLRPQPLQHIGGVTSEAIVPDIQTLESYSFVSGYQGCKRVLSNDSDCLIIGEEELGQLDQDQLQFQEAKRFCGGYTGTSPSPDHFQVGGSTAELKNIEFFNCGGNSPVSSASTSPGTDFTPSGTQTLDKYFPEELPLFPVPEMQSQPQPQPMMNAHADKYELVISEQPEEVHA
jgi:hypothetical protein